MSNMGNSNPKVIAAAFAAAAVIGGGALFVMNGGGLSMIPGFGTESRETKPSTASNGGGAAANTPQQENTPAEAVQAIVKLAENHDAATFKSRVDMKMAEKLGTDGIILLYDGADVSLPGKVRETIDGALAGAVPEKLQRIAIDLGLIGVDFAGVGEVQENGNKANVTVNLGGENLPNGFPLKLVMEKRDGKWNVVSISNFEDYIKTLKAGRNAAAMQYVKQEQPFLKKYNETINSLKGKYPVLSTEYVNGYEAAEKELAAGYASLTPPLAAEQLIGYRKKRFELATEHIRLIRAHLSGDHSDANRDALKKIESQIDTNAHNIKTTIERYKR